MEWFRRLAEVPKVSYPGSPGVDRTRLQGHNSEPKIEVFRFEGRRHESMSWPLPNGSSTASPASSWQTTSRAGETLAQTSVRGLFEALELPGTPIDYHFAIQRCCDQLWDTRIRREEPWVYVVIEKLCLLDIRLVEALPDIIKADTNNGPTYYAVTGFGRLINLYRNEGYLYEAFDVAKRAIRFDQQQDAFENLKQRVALLEAEGVS